jgi:hypothetical protein
MPRTIAVERMTAHMREGVSKVLARAQRVDIIIIVGAGAASSAGMNPCVGVFVVEEAFWTFPRIRAVS